jgi:hypothetical protein
VSVSIRIAMFLIMGLLVVLLQKPIKLYAAKREEKRVLLYSDVTGD